MRIDCCQREQISLLRNFISEMEFLFGSPDSDHSEDIPSWVSFLNAYSHVFPVVDVIPFFKCENPLLSSLPNAISLHLSPSGRIWLFYHV